MNKKYHQKNIAKKERDIPVTKMPVVLQELYEYMKRNGQLLSGQELPRELYTRRGYTEGQLLAHLGGDTTTLTHYCLAGYTEQGSRLFFSGFTIKRTAESQEKTALEVQGIEALIENLKKTPAPAKKTLPAVKLLKHI